MIRCCGKNNKKNIEFTFNRRKISKKTKFFFNLIGLLLFITSYYFYYLSLEKCFEGEDVCCRKSNWVILLIKRFIISTVIIIFLFYLIIYGILSKIHLFHFILIFIYYYSYSHSSYFHDHGALNLIGLFGCLFTSLFLLLILKIFLAIFKIKYKYKILLGLFLIFLYNILNDPTNCNDWAKGLNNTYIENDIYKYGCQIKFPKNCDYKVLSFTQDLSKLSHLSCSDKSKNSRTKILKFSRSQYVNENTSKFGFPLTNNEEGQKDGRDDIVLKNYTSHNLMDMDKNIPPNLNKPELIVDFSNDPLGEMKIIILKMR